MPCVHLGQTANPYHVGIHLEPSLSISCVPFKHVAYLYHVFNLKHSFPMPCVPIEYTAYPYHVFILNTPHIHSMYST